MTQSEWFASADPAAMLTFCRGHNANRVEGVGGGDPINLSDRKLCLFAVAYCRRPEVWNWLTDDAACERCRGWGRQMNPNGGYREFSGSYPTWDKCYACSGSGRVNRSRRAVEVVERYADGLATLGELAVVEHNAGDAWTAVADLWYTTGAAAAAAVVAAAVAAAFVAWAAADSTARRDRTDPWDAARAIVWATDKGAAGADLLRCVIGNPFQPTLRHDSLVMEELLWWNDGMIPKTAQLIYDERDFGRLPLLGDMLEDAGADDAELLTHCRGRGPHGRGCFVIDALLGKE